MLIKVLSYKFNIRDSLIPFQEIPYYASGKS
jgi:hypothetical protein